MTRIAPYYQEALVTIYNGDCRELMPGLSAEAIITDPVWPNASPLLCGGDRPWELFAEACQAIPASVVRLAVQLGTCSDIRFLRAVPDRFPYFRTCWLAFAPPSYRGRAIVDSDVAFLFGAPPAGGGMVKGMCYATEKPTFPRNCGRNRSQKTAYTCTVRQDHPAARKLRHVRFLANQFGGASVIDPFAGSGTTAVACKELGIPCTLIEIEERFCELAVRRLSQGVLDLAEVGT